MLTNLTHFKGVTGDFLPAINFTSIAYADTALASADGDLTCLNFNSPTSAGTTLSTYVAEFDMLLVAMEFKMGAGGGTGTGVLNITGNILGTCNLGTFPSLATNTAGAIAWSPYVTQVGSSLWRKISMSDYMAVPSVGRTHKTAFIPKGTMLIDTLAVEVTMSPGTYSVSNKTLGVKLYFKNVHGQGYSVSNFTV
jgi:hypothetical protein